MELHAEDKHWSEHARCAQRHTQRPDRPACGTVSTGSTPAFPAIVPGPQTTLHELPTTEGTITRRDFKLIW